MATALDWKVFFLYIFHATKKFIHIVLPFEFPCSCILLKPPAHCKSLGFSVTQLSSKLRSGIKFDASIDDSVDSWWRRWNNGVEVGVAYERLGLLLLGGPSPQEEDLFVFLSILSVIYEHKMKWKPPELLNFT